jgi:phage gp36-like protein
MAYAVYADLSSRMPEQTLIALTDEQGIGVGNEAVADAALADAAAEIDAMIGARYAVPVTPVPDLLKKVSLDLAVEGLYARRHDVETPDAVVRAAKASRSLLLAISRRDASLPGLTEATPANTSGAETSAGTRLFSRDSLRDLL